MRRSCLITVLALVLALPMMTASARTVLSGTFDDVALTQQAEGPERGDDLERIQSWRTFLDRADRAFFAARMNTEAVRAKIAAADERLKELREAPRNDPGGRSDITGDVAFLERAHRAFTAARMSTTEVQKWLREAKEGS